jgi:CspA family cold shock protein
MADRIRGVVKWFDNKKGFGFIMDDKEKQYFVHHTAITRKTRGFVTLYEKQVVTFLESDEGKGPKAIDVIIL